MLNSPGLWPTACHTTCTFPLFLGSLGPSVPLKSEIRRIFDLGYPEIAIWSAAKLGKAYTFMSCCAYNASIPHSH